MKLATDQVELRLLELADQSAFAQLLAAFPALSELSVTRIPRAHELTDYFTQALADIQNGSALVFGLYHQNQLVGSTRLRNIDRQHRRCELGFTFVAPPWQRTSVNTHAKYLLLCEAFEGQQLQRVELYTDETNHASRQAIERIGAQFEGRLRRHMMIRQRIRDSVLYSITIDDWPAVKHHFESDLLLLTDRS